MRGATNAGRYGRRRSLQGNWLSRNQISSVSNYYRTWGMTTSGRTVAMVIYGVDRCRITLGYCYIYGLCPIDISTRSRAYIYIYFNTLYLYLWSRVEQKAFALENEIFDGILFLCHVELYAGLLTFNPSSMTYRRGSIMCLSRKSRHGGGSSI